MLDLNEFDSKELTAMSFGLTVGGFIVKAIADFAIKPVLQERKINRAVERYMKQHENTEEE